MIWAQCPYKILTWQVSWRSQKCQKYTDNYSYYFPLNAESPDWQVVSSGPPSTEEEYTVWGRERGQQSNRGHQTNLDTPPSWDSRLGWI